MTEAYFAGLIIIGDEILRGHVQDANTIYLARKLQSIGVKIQKVIVIPDETDIIAKEVLEASKNYSIVFTSGGVGPTHDDVTYEGVAKGFNLTLLQNNELLETITKLFPNDPESHRLAIVPSPCELIYVTSHNSKAEDVYAVVKVGNVYILPGSPRYFRPAVDTIVPGLEPCLPLHNDSVDVDLDELSLVSILDEQARRWDGSVAIGSYPQPSHEPRTRITFEGRSREAVATAKRDLLAMLPHGSRTSRRARRFDEECAKRVYASRDDQQHVARAFNILEECYDKYKPNEIFLCFNGGKDCTVVLHLAATLIHLKKLNPPVCLYIIGNAFPEIDEFVRETALYYGLEIEYRKGPMKQVLAQLLEEKPKLKACLMGTRKGDPGSHSLEPFTQTDPEWPKMMRVSPIIEWSYSQVWQFLMKHEVPYCSLYDEGYTSLGAKDSTTKNPLLKDPINPSNYLPAYTLADDSTERHGRE